MTLHFELNGIPTRNHPWDNQYQSWKVPLKRYPELETINKDSRLHLNLEADPRYNHVILFLDPDIIKKEGYSMCWGWRQYKLKKL